LHFPITIVAKKQGICKKIIRVLQYSPFRAPSSGKYSRRVFACAKVITKYSFKFKSLYRTLHVYNRFFKIIHRLMEKTQKKGYNDLCVIYIAALAAEY